MIRSILIFRILLLVISGSSLVAQSQPDDSPNVLLILSDDHSYPYLGCYGHPDLKTPNLDRLASEGVLFNHAYTAAAQCVPSRASILTGRSVLDVDMARFSAPLPANVKTIPDYLNQKGYFTGICGRHYHLDGSSYMADATAQAFEKYDLITFPERVNYLRNGTDDEVLEQFTAFLEQVPDGKPFFMWMNYSDPHRKFTADDYEPVPESVTVPESMPDLPEVRADLAAHLGEINRLDNNVGKVLNEIKTRGLEANTIIVFMGDNGAALLRGKGTLYDLGLHVPLIIKWPGGFPSNKLSEVLVSGEDILPTLLDAANIEPDQEVTGISLLPAILGGDYDPHQYLFAHRGTHGTGLPIHTARFDIVRTAFNRDYRLIYNLLWPLPFTPVDFNNSKMWKKLNEMHEQGTLEEKYDNAFFSVPRPMFELYDRRNDPYELNNLSGNPKYSKLEYQLKAALHEWMILNHDYAPLPIPPVR